MRTLTCDICKKDIQSPVPDRNYFIIAHRDICESCHDKLESQIKTVVREKEPFEYEWYNGLIQESIEKAVKKGKFEVK
jgi:hypothetical protein